MSETNHPVMESSTVPGRADPMRWSGALNFLMAAGWRVEAAEDGRGHIGIADAPAPSRVLIDLPDNDDADIDGHGLLRAAGGGALDVALADSVTDDTLIDEVLVGLNWSFVRAGALAGIARSPDRGTEGARTARHGEPIAGRPLCELAQWLCSLDPLRRSIGLAAVNAFWNRADRPAASKPWGLAHFEPPGEGLVIVGGFRAAAKRLPAAHIIEREPKGDDVSADAADAVLANAKAIAITAQTLMNGSLDPLLARVGHIPDRVLLGPSAPVAPPCLDVGLTRVSGLAITDPDAAAAFIKETGTMIALDTMTRQLEISR